jgi:hypothetical protein
VLPNNALQRTCEKRTPLSTDVCSPLKREGHKAVVLGSECTYDFGGSYHRASSRKAILMDIKRLSSTKVEYIGRHNRKWADFVTLEVRKGADGWKVLRVIKHEAA